MLTRELRQNDSRGHAPDRYSLIPPPLRVRFCENSLGIGAKFSGNTTIFSYLKNEDNNL